MGGMDFCMRIAADLILKEINDDSPSNVVMSPMSITVMLHLIASGSNGETLAQFLNVLGSKETDEHNSKSKQILSLFAADVDKPSSSPSPPPDDFSASTREKRPRMSMPKPWTDYFDVESWPEGEDGEEPVFSMASALWVDHEYSLKSSFKDIAESVYNALVKNVDLVREGNKVKEEVNAWAEKSTNGLIKDLLSKDVTLEPPLCLANALYFKGTWETPFRVSDSHTYDFHLLNGETTKVPFMIKRFEHYGFASFIDFKLLCLPYERRRSSNKKISMYVLLPHAQDGVKGLAEKLKSDPAMLHPRYFRLPKTKLSSVWIPKMKFSAGFNATELMKSRGLTLPFREEADFTNMVDRRNVHISMFLHKAVIEVDEEGTKAAAATFVGLRGSGSRMRHDPLPSFVADHPFLFMIVEDVSSHVVFSGAVLNPSS